MRVLYTLMVKTGQKSQQWFNIGKKDNNIQFLCIYVTFITIFRVKKSDLPHSYLRDSTGFEAAALRDLEQTTIKAIKKALSPDKR